VHAYLNKIRLKIKGNYVGETSDPVHFPEFDVSLLSPAKDKIFAIICITFSVGIIGDFLFC